MGGRDDRLWPAAAFQPAHPAAGGRRAQFGIFATVLGALTLNYFGLIVFTLQAALIGIIGGADGPTAIYLSASWRRSCWGHRGGGVLHMALVPLNPAADYARADQREERKIRMVAAHGEQAGKILPVVLLLLVALLRRTPRRCWDVLLYAI